MGLPKEVEKQVEEANKLLMSIGEEKTAPEEPDKKEETGQPQEEQEVVEEPKEEAAVKEASEEPEKVVEDWEHKYKVLQGKYNAELASIAQENQYLKAQLEALQKLITAQETKKEEIPKSPAEQLDSEEEEFKKEFPDIYNVVEKMIKKRLSDVENLKNTVNTISQHATKSLEQKFYDALNKEVPDWQAINVSPDFAKWLQGKDEYSPYTRYENLVTAASVWDAETVINILKKYKNDTNIKENIEEQVSAPKKNIEKYTSPSTTQKPRIETTQPAGSSKKVFSKEEINKFYQDLALGKVNLSKQDKAKMEQEIWNAIVEGRVS